MTASVVVTNIVLFSNDMAKLAAFYNTIGFDLNPVGGWTGITHYLDVVKTNGSNFFFEIWPIRDNQSAASISLGFKVNNVPETLQKLIALGVTVTRPHPRMYECSTIAAVIDPDGRSITLYQQ